MLSVVAAGDKGVWALSQGDRILSPHRFASQGVQESALGAGAWGSLGPDESQGVPSENVQAEFRHIDEQERMATTEKLSTLRRAAARQRGCKVRACITARERRVGAY